MVHAEKNFEDIMESIRESHAKLTISSNPNGKRDDGAHVYGNVCIHTNYGLDHSNAVNLAICNQSF